MTGAATAVGGVTVTRDFARARREVLARYAFAPARARFHIAVRDFTCPFARILRHVPAEGRILDVGCGHGFFTHLVAATRPGTEVLGIDVDAAKIALARESAGGLDRPVFDTTPVQEIADGGFAAVTVTHVLYLLPEELRRDVIAHAARLLAPGGVLVVAENDTAPAWKYRVSAWQEVLAVRLLGITAGGHVAFWSAARYLQEFHANGLVAEAEPIDRGYPYSHVVVIGRKV